MTTPVIQLNLSAAQLLVIYEFLWSTKLGSSNVFESEISELMVELETPEFEEFLNDAASELGRPQLGVQDDGEDLTFTILAE